MNPQVIVVAAMAIMTLLKTKLSQGKNVVVAAVKHVLLKIPTMPESFDITNGLDGPAPPTAAIPIALDAEQLNNHPDHPDRPPCRSRGHPLWEVSAACLNAGWRGLRVE